jgi:hypothetical protein
MRRSSRFHATASKQPQVLIIARSRNQNKARCLNEMAGFPFGDCATSLPFIVSRPKGLQPQSKQQGIPAQQEPWSVTSCIASD